MEKGPVPLVILISGRGSNLQALMEATRDGRLPARIALVVSNRAEAAGLELARAAGIETSVLSHRGFSTRAAYDRELVSLIAPYKPALVCLAGFMRLLGPSFCGTFENRVVNIHPSLLPAFPGVDAQQQALDHGVKVSGATVHFVTPELDAGPIILQAAVPVEDTDTAQTLAARILREEHRLYPEAIRRLLTDPFHIEGRRVVFGAAAPRGLR